MELLRENRVLVAPTDTVYGVMCRYDSPTAIERLYSIKERPQHKAIPVLIGDFQQLPLVTAPPLSEAARILTERFWPGPLTLILAAHKGLPAELTAGKSTVGVRMPDHAALRDLMREIGPLAATSANRSGVAEASTAQQALEQLGGLVPLILRDDALANLPTIPMASTIVDLSGSEPAIIRQGPIAAHVLNTLTVLGYSSC